MRRLLPLRLCVLMLTGCNVGLRSMRYSRPLYERPIYTPVYSPPLYECYPVRVPVLRHRGAPSYYPRVRMIPAYRYYPRR